MSWCPVSQPQGRDGTPHLRVTGRPSLHFPGGEVVSRGLPYLDFSLWQRSGGRQAETPAQPSDRAEWVSTVTPLNDKLQPQNRGQQG